MLPVMEGYISKNPLRERNLENLRDKLFGPVLPIYINTGHYEVKGLYCIEIC
jgi:hypothetical protein